MPKSYSSVDEEYTALTTSAALIDRSLVGRLQVDGKDALDLLDRLSTNDLSSLEMHTGQSTVLTSNKGRIVDLLFVLRVKNGLMVLTAPETRQKVADWIEFFIFTEDVSVQDTTEKSIMLGLTGPNAASQLEMLIDTTIPSISPHNVITVTLGHVDITVVQTDFLKYPGYDIIATADNREFLWRTFVDAGFVPVGSIAEQIVRIESGVPAYGSELSESFNPLEAGLIELVSFTKGCYVGQEVVTRLNTYQKVQKNLVGLQFDIEELPEPQTVILQGHKQAGLVTSVAHSPRLKHGIGLGYVRKELSDAGILVCLKSEGDPRTAQVVDLPFN